MKLRKEIIVNKDIEAAWKVLGHDFATVHVWASAVNHSAGSGSPFNGASCSERGCEIPGMGRISEKIISYSDTEHSLSYAVREGMPKMIKQAVNTWQLSSLGAGRSKLIMVMDITPGGFMGMLMQPMIRMMMSRMGSRIAADFKYYVENGRPSEAKLKALRKRKG
ncbi:MAG: SRPBCC family protein [Sphingobacteriales bacterium]|nr:SRPBCC family protein [Sphingobacteriales bacterium]